MAVPGGFSIRPAGLDDLADVARIHVLSWQHAYRGQMPQDYLDRLDIPARQKKWEEHFRAAPIDQKNLFLACDKDEPVGFVSFGPARDARLREWGEIYALYFLQSAWGRGGGYELFKKAEQQLSVIGHAKIFIWVLSTNQNAIKAYTRWGGKTDPAFAKHDLIGGQTISEIAVLFDLA